MALKDIVEDAQAAQRRQSALKAAVKVSPDLNQQTKAAEKVLEFYGEAEGKGEFEVREEIANLAAESMTITADNDLGLFRKRLDAYFRYITEGK